MSITLSELVAKCKGSVTVEFNDHTTCYWSVEQEILSRYANVEEAKEDLGEENYNRLIQGDTLVSIQYYPHTPVAFDLVYGRTLEECLEQVNQELFGWVEE